MMGGPQEPGCPKSLQALVQAHPPFVAASRAPVHQASSDSVVLKPVTVFLGQCLEE